MGTRVEDLQRHFDHAKRCGARIVHLPTNVPQLFASAITMPNLTIQVRNDAWTKNPEDAQKTFDMLGTKDKEMIWVENTTHRFRDDYNYFGRYPEKVLAFFAKHMKQAVDRKKEVVEERAVA